MCRIRNEEIKKESKYSSDGIGRRNRIVFSRGRVRYFFEVGVLGMFAY